MKKKYSTILFDADNTLLDFDKDEDTALRKVLAEYNVPISEENVKTYKKINLGMWKALEIGELTKPELKRTRFRLFFEAIGFESDIDPFEINERYLYLLGDGGNLLGGVPELLKELKEEGFDLYIVTNGVAATQARRLGKSGILPLFSEVFVSETVGYQKPRKEYFDYVLEHIPEKDKEKILIVGDSLSSDIKGAMNAGLDCVWFNLHGAELGEGFIPTYIINDISEVRDLL